MRQMIRQLGLALALVGLAGCGLKGPLYFPPPEQPKKTTTQPTEQQQQAAKSADVDGLVTDKQGMQGN